MSSKPTVGHLVACKDCGKTFASPNGLGGHRSWRHRKEQGKARHPKPKGTAKPKRQLREPKYERERKEKPLSVEARIQQAEKLLLKANDRIVLLSAENKDLRKQISELESKAYSAAMKRMEDAEAQLRKNLETDRDSKHGGWLSRRKG